MKKIFALLLVVCLLFVFASCEKAPKPDLSNNDDVSEIVMDKDNESENDDIIDNNSENDIIQDNEKIESNDGKTPYGESYMLSDILMLKITQNYFLTCPLEFNEGETIPFKDVFYYYTFAACYTFDEKCIEPELVKYYDPKTMDFSVPHKIVDDYIESIFNTKADTESVEYYNKDKGTYDFDRHLGECYYGFSVTQGTVLCLADEQAQKIIFKYSRCKSVAEFQKLKITLKEKYIEDRGRFCVLTKR